MSQRLAAYMAIGAALLASGRASALEYDLRGQISAYHLEARNGGERSHGSGIRYIPIFELAQQFQGSAFIDLEASVDAWAAWGSEIEDDQEVQLYRLKLRFATARSETRLGLQKINFGPGRLLRPLRWFDRLDPRDPLQITEGVYALRFTYTASNNANIWLWGLYGNNDPKGYEALPSADDRPELGGRLQIPAGPGELALTLHTRKVEPPIWFLHEIDETRVALDGRWDIHVGLWFEAVLQRQESEELETTWNETLMVGSDYTFGIGSGLHVLLEHMATAVTMDFPEPDWIDDAHMTAFMFGYPVGYLDYVQAIGYYDWENEDYYQFASWQRTWDNLAINLSIFRNPERTGTGLAAAMASGTGGQVILMYNH
jgi:hypothetical protein